ncbi:MAG: hypothetical protein HQL14_08025 [Candidatus Omnitrophica bacterium]|nr:hypothetical protein [Candidatus Omnitrophota bacterium]
MTKFLTKVAVGILTLCIAGVFVFRVYQQREALSLFYSWLISGRYIFEGINVEQMQQYSSLRDLNGSIPALVEIYKASNSSASLGLEKAEVEQCRKYYHKVLGYMPQMKEAHVFLGFCEDKAGNIPEAFLEFKQGLESPAGVFWASYNLGVLAMMNGKLDMAEVLFFQAVKLPVRDVLKNILNSRLYQQYMQAGNLTPQKIWEGISDARTSALENLKVIEESRLPSSIPTRREIHLRVF